MLQNVTQSSAAVDLIADFVYVFIVLEHRAVSNATRTTLSSNSPLAHLSTAVQRNISLKSALNAQRSLVTSSTMRRLKWIRSPRIAKRYATYYV